MFPDIVPPERARSALAWPPLVRFVPETVPVEATEVGVIAPRVRVIAGVVVLVATEPETPFAVVTLTEVTVPVPAAVQVPSARRKFAVPPPLAGTTPCADAVNTSREVVSPVKDVWPVPPFPTGRVPVTEAVREMLEKVFDAPERVLFVSV
jgi:hypothetical protein